MCTTLQLNSNNEEDEETFSKLANFVNNLFPAFDIAGVCKIDRSVISSMMSHIVHYTIIVIQFRE